MNYLKVDDPEFDPHRDPTTNFLRLYGLAPYPVRQPIDKWLAEPETLAVNLCRQVQRGLES